MRQNRRLHTALTAVVVWLFALVEVGMVAAQTSKLEYTGYLDDRVSEKTYTVTLAAGESVYAEAMTTEGNLDAVLTLSTPDGRDLVRNDDRNAETLDPALGYTAAEAGSYLITVSRYPDTDTRGRFILTITVGDESVLAPLSALSRVALSGEVLTRDTEHFRIHYTLTGTDAVTENYVEALALSVEEIWRIQIGQMGWQPPPPDGVRGGNALYDVYLADLIGKGEHALGYASVEDEIGDNPATPDLVERGATSYIVLENDFDLGVTIVDATTTSLMRTTMSHELNHAIQFAYDSAEPRDSRWYYEATATWMETAALVKDEDASYYTDAIFLYPEVCLGSNTIEIDQPFAYAAWLFIDTLAQAHDGTDSIIALWQHIAQEEGLDGLVAYLDAHGETVTEALTRYAIHNLLRVYALAPDFPDTPVWVENVIDDVGRWTYQGYGVQELAVNYYMLDLDKGSYYVGLINDGGSLLLAAVGVRGGRADSFMLGRGAVIDTTPYDHVVVIVVNPALPASLSACAYADYSLDVAAGKGEPVAADATWDATQFIVPE